ncbi:MAG: hypothetical protein IAF00_03355, partial [Phycisphaerales bacterium]|nr:hypothetical protein [Phycisphaerales bacterium]
MAMSLDSSQLRVLAIDPRTAWNMFLRWWRDGLLAWLPVNVRRWLIGSSRGLVIAVEEGKYVLLREELGQSQELEQLDQPTLDDQAVARWFRAEKAKELILRFPAERALTRTLSL